METPSKADVKYESLNEMQRLALEGCDSAARIFLSHSKRPYFKKIDLLCDRLKQDLTTTDKAVVNINSHGVAWAIKDFIFVFNRIINGWVIMRDYFYSYSEGMQCVRELIDPNFYQDFLEWQVATSKLTKSLTQSFNNMHSRDQRNVNRRTSSGTDSNSSSPSTSASSSKSNVCKNLFGPLIAENSEQAQLRVINSGGYLKSALYKPVSSDISFAPETAEATHELDSFKLLYELLGDSTVGERSGNPIPLYKRCGVETTPSDNWFSLWFETI